MSDPMAIVGSSLRLVGGLAKFLPEPRNKMFSSFGATLQDVGNTIGGPASNLTINPDYAGLIARQIEMQLQMQAVSMESNIERSKHETAMTPIRNVKVA